MKSLKRKQDDDLSDLFGGYATTPESSSQDPSGEPERPFKRSRTQADFEASHTNEAEGQQTQDLSTVEPAVSQDTTITNPAPTPTPNPPILSARAQRRAKVTGEIGSDDKPKGLVRYGLDGTLEHSADDSKTWVAAIYHNNLRAELIQEAAKGGKYDHKRNEGEGATDVTSFLASQKSWGPERKSWPDVLFQIEVVKDKNLPKTVPVWRRNERLVIDHDNHPMRDFSSLLPATLSSEAEGWLMEAFIRSDRRVQMKDLRGRMPKDIVIADKSGTGNSQLTKPLFTMRTITQRTLRFRGQAGLKARDTRGGTDAINKGIDALIPAELLQKNNSKDLGRALTAAEVKTLTKLNEGKYPQRGRNGKAVPSANNSSAMVTKNKRKRTSEVAENEEGTAVGNVKRARHEGAAGNAAFQETGQMLVRGSGLGLPTSELSSTPEFTPDFLDRNLSTPDNVDYSYPDPSLFTPYDLSTHGELLEDAANFPAVSEGLEQSGDLNVGHDQTHHTPHANNSSSHGWNVEEFNQLSGPSTYGQSHYPEEAPYPTQGTYVGGELSEQHGLSNDPMHGRLSQATEEAHHNPNIGDWSPNENFAINPGYGQAHHTSAVRDTSTHGYNTEGGSYLESGASTHPIFRQAPTATMAQNPGYDQTRHTPVTYNASIHRHNMQTGASIRTVYRQGPRTTVAQNRGHDIFHYTPVTDPTSTHHHNMQVWSSIRTLYRQVPVATVAQNHGYGRIRHNLVGDLSSAHSHGTEGGLYHEPCDSAHPLYGQSPFTEENLYQDFGASTLPVHSQAPVVTSSQNQDSSVGRSLAKDTVLRTGNSPPKAQSGADRVAPGRKRKSKARQKKNKQPVETATAPASVGLPTYENEHQTVALDEVPSVPMTSDTPERLVYTTYDGRPAYCSSEPYHSGSSLEPSSEVHGARTGAEDDNRPDLGRQSRTNYFEMDDSEESTIAAIAEYFQNAGNSRMPPSSRGWM
ncbi:hypothetical protein MMC30_001198 [Trapelia coarctata]|nr:hypothetical protein [Trapelia coarctata]